MSPSDKRPTKPRLSLSKKATQEGIVAELLSLLESVTADGRVTEREVLDIQTWLNDNSSTDIVGIEYLRTTVTQILSDGIVTPDETKAMYAAVERVLPLELRRSAKERRMALEDLERATARAQKETAKAQAREERERDRRLLNANFMVAGVLHEGRAQVVERYVRTEQSVFLIRQPQNAHDANAVEIRLANGMQIGFAPREDAASLARFLDMGCRYNAYVTKILNGRRAPIPVVQADIYGPSARVAGLKSQNDAPERTVQAEGSKGTGIGCLTVLLFLVAAAVLLLGG